MSKLFLSSYPRLQHLRTHFLYGNEQEREKSEFRHMDPGVGSYLVTEEPVQKMPILELDAG